MKRFVICLLIVFALSVPTQKAHALNAKGKAFLVICTYGTVGGALLGFASMAFGTNSRAIAQGASLGLYAGIAFGAYVINSHGQQGSSYEEDPYVDPQQGPPPGYGQPPIDNGGFGAPPPQEDAGGFFGSPERTIEINQDLMYNYRLKNRNGRVNLPVYVNLLNARF